MKSAHYFCSNPAHRKTDRQDRLTNCPDCITSTLAEVTRSVATRFGRHGMPPPASNDTGAALGQDGSDWSRDLATLTFNLGGHGACRWCGSSSSIRIPSSEVRRPCHSKDMAHDVCQHDWAWWPWPDLLTLKLVCESHLRWVTLLCTRRTDRQKQRLMPLSFGRGHNKLIILIK